MTGGCTLLLCFLCLFLPYSAGAVPADFPDYCPTTLCKGVLISYPFWNLGNKSQQNAHCGYPSFGLSCSTSNDTYPILALPSGNYYIKDINYTSKSVTLIDMDVVGQKCPRAKHNVTIGDSLPFDYNPGDVNITFYFNCTIEGVYGTLPVASQITCFEPYMAMKPSYVFLDDAVPSGINWAESCEDTVISTVRETEVTEYNLINQFTGAMNTGFMLDWDTAKACGGCEATGGLCGFNYRTQAFLCYCDDGSIRLSTSSRPYCKGKSNTTLRLGLASAMGLVLFVSIIILCLCIKIRPSICSVRTRDDKEIENFIEQHGSLAPKRFSYSDVKRLTHSFGQKLGEGGFGTVYKGKLPNGTLVAVKLLKASKGNGEEFINEVASISRTSHINIVTLLGYCFEGHKRALIYEYMSKGSLDRFLSDQNFTAGSDRRLGWNQLYRISVGIANGLEYLHRGCNTRILHFDIKPQNILLDDHFCPKISDFGLSKLCLNRESIVSMLVARGTIGYIAPEVFCRNFSDVSHKSDVYSYGMMLIEMVRGKKQLKVEVDRSSEMYFHDEVYQLIEPKHIQDVYGDLTEEDKEIARKIAMVGVWCIQTHPKKRPHMRSVIDMLEGSVEALQIPPKPMFSPPISPTIDYSSTTASV